jgi:ADP-dependent phosphofructokinase/glucokinase
MLIPKGRFATGLYANWDSFVKVNREALRWIKNLKEARPRGLVLSSLEEAAYTLKEAFTRGGREYLISKDLYEKLDSTFRRRRRALGGNGFHMGRALYELGIRPLVSYPCRPPRLMATSPTFQIANGEKLKTPLEAVREADPEYDHIVFEFKRNPRLGIRSSGRQIFSWDLMSSTGLFDTDFLNYTSNSKNIDVLILGYAHLLLPRYKRRTDEVVGSLHHSGRPKVHLELGRGSEESIRYAMKKFSDHNCAESWGMNEDECTVYFGAASREVRDLIEAAAESLRKYGLSRVCVHSPDFVFSVSKYDLEKETTALRAGCIASTALTLGGIKENLDRVAALPTSKITPLRKRMDGYNACLLPTYVNPEPKILTGLGDTFAGVQAAIVLR